MNKHAKVLCFMAGPGIEIHNLVREKGPVQRRDGKGEQCDGEIKGWPRAPETGRTWTTHGTGVNGREAACVGRLVPGDEAVL